MKSKKRGSRSAGAARSRRLNASSVPASKPKRTAKPRGRVVAKRAAVASKKKGVAKRAPAASKKRVVAKRAPAASKKKGVAQRAPAASKKKVVAQRAPAASKKKGVAQRAPAAPKKRGVAQRAPAAPKKVAARATRPAPGVQPTRIAADVAPAYVVPASSTALRVAEVAPATAAPDSARVAAVRVGRLPPRGEAAGAPARELLRSPAPTPPAASVAQRATPSAPRPELDAAAWQRAEAFARELEVSELSSEQRKAIRAALEGKDVIVSMAAGLGRAACFAVPARLLAQPVLVLGPRPAILRELHDRLLQRKTPVVRFDPCASDAVRRLALERIGAGGALVVLATTTAAHRDELVSALCRSGVAMVAVDDAQTATGASDELSPSATELSRAFERFGRPPVMALSGAASPAARHEIVATLGLCSPVHVDAASLRKNLALDVLDVRGEARQRALVQLVMSLRRPGVIFAPTAREVDSIYSALVALRLPVHRFHPHMPPGDRVGEQLNFMLPGRRSIMVATSAFVTPSGLVGVGEAALLDRAPLDFGLCLEKRDLRFVLHWAAPASLEQYAREISLAGRDGEESTCVLFHDGSDRARHEALLAQARIPSRHLTHFAKALEPAALDARPRTLESLALSSGISRRLIESLAAILDDAGLVTLASGWLTVEVSVPVLAAGAQRLAARLDRLRSQDARRLGSMSAYVDATGCRTAALARYFGEVAPEACGRCGACRGSLVPGFEAELEGAHQRRPTVEAFSLGRADAFGMAVVPPARVARPLTVKLSDFRRGR